MLCPASAGAVRPSPEKRKSLPPGQGHKTRSAVVAPVGIAASAGAFRLIPPPRGGSHRDLRSLALQLSRLTLRTGAGLDNLGCVLLSSLAIFILGSMTVERTTISLPAPLMRALREEAARRRLSLSALIAERATQGRPRPDWYGSIDDIEDLSLRAEELLREQLNARDHQR